MSNGTFYSFRQIETAGTNTIQWDGADGSMGVNRTGPGGVDVTGGGSNDTLFFENDALNMGVSYGVINVYDMAGGESGVLMPMPSTINGASTTYSVDFALFRNVDLTNVGAITFTFDGTGGGGPSIDAIRFASVVPPDTTAPTITASATRADGTAYAAASWTNQSVTVTFTCDDAGSGVLASSVTAPVTRSTDGSTTVPGSCRDEAGNVAETTFGPVQIDKTAPTLSASAALADGTAYTAGSIAPGPVTVTFSCADPDGSGVATSTTPVTVTVPTTSVEGACTDLAGNRATASFGPIAFDATPPVVSAVATHADGTAYAAGTWTNRAVTVTLVCEDAGSGIATLTGPATYATEGTATYAGTCVDTAGNSANASFGPILIDLTAPVVTYAGNLGTYGVAAGVAITCAASDALSGVASSTCADVSGPATSFATGPNTVSATATDLAGNVGTDSVTFTVVVVQTDLCALTTQFSERSGISVSLCKQLVNAGVPDYVNHVQAQSGKALTADEAALLIRLAGYLP
ncbi:MAG: hypothetical protein H0U40_03565 [Chloroflexia bacterium]|nr:hypothetical protein [Chloroflexia bacterium]